MLPGETGTRPPPALLFDGHKIGLAVMISGLTTLKPADMLVPTCFLSWWRGFVFETLYPPVLHPTVLRVQRGCNIWPDDYLS